MNKKIISVVAAAVMLLSFAGCAADGDDPTSEAGGSQPSAFVTQGASVLTADIALDTVVAEFQGAPDMNVTFGDFLKEYKYNLIGYQITDDSVEPYATAMEGQREYIINYLVNENIMEKKFNDLGLSLTDEELKQIDEDTQAGIANMKENFKTRVQISHEGEALSADELAALAEEEYQKMLTDSGLTEADFRHWQESIYIQNKLTQHVNDGFTYEYSEAEKEVEKLIENAKSAYEADNSDYDPDALKSLYIPEGSRYVKHILLKFDDETTAEISALRQAGSNDEADKLREEKIGEMNDKITEVQSKVEAGEDFAALMTEYSQDGDTTASYLIAPGTTMYMDGFAECALAISELGDTDTVVTDYGWHIIKYTEDAVVTDEDISSYTDALYDYLLDAYRTQNLNEAMASWREEYKFTIDRELLMLSEETAEAAAE